MNIDYALAPVVIFAYNRYDNLFHTIESLKANIYAEKIDLFIFSDFQKNTKNAQSVEKVRKYIHSVKGFKNITIIERDENYGLAKNIIEGVTEIINKYEKVIVLEDDLLTSKNFICYMNNALDYYKENNNIFSISGFSLKLNKLKDLAEDTYLTYRPSSWGWATWKDQWENIDWDVTDFNEFIKNKEEIEKFNRGGIDMSRMLKHCMEGKNHSWAIRWSYAMYKQNRFSVYPKVSKIQNIGFGIDATNCSGANIYQTIIDETSKCSFNFTNDTCPTTILAKEFKYQYSYMNKLTKKITATLNKLFK